MKDLKAYITERINGRVNERQIGHVNERIKDVYLYHPKTKNELIDIIEKEIRAQGYKADLNCIDTSNITDMNAVFTNSKFNGDISKWDTSKVTNMYGMFYESKFNGDISKWDVSNVTNMRLMFSSSEFNGDISNWDVSGVKNMEDMHFMFYGSPLDGKEPKWYKK